MRMKFTFDNVLSFVAGAALVYFRNWQAFVFLVLVFAFVLVRYYESRKSNEFVFENKEEMRHTTELDIVSTTDRCRITSAPTISLTRASRRAFTNTDWKERTCCAV